MDWGILEEDVESMIPMVDHKGAINVFKNRPAGGTRDHRQIGRHVTTLILVNNTLL